MKTLLKVSAVILLASFLLTGCGGQKNENKPADSSQQTTSNAGKPADATYGAKSGIVYFEDVIMKGMNQTFYFDDYGKKEARYTLMEMEMMGQKIKSGNVEINADGYMINYDIEKKEGTKTKSFGSIGGTKDLPKDLAQLTKEMMDQYHMKDIGKKDILGKPCQGYEVNAMGMKTEVWIWNGIMLASKVYMGEGSKPIELNATKIETDVAIPADKFQVPADIKIKETGAGE